MSQIELNELPGETTLALTNKNGICNRRVSNVRPDNDRKCVIILRGLIILALTANVVLIWKLVNDRNSRHADTEPSPNHTTLPPETPPTKAPTSPKPATVALPRKKGAALLNFKTCGNYSNNRTANGTEASPKQFPWMTLLLNSMGHVICGGTLISERYILTAARCVQNVNYVRLGEHNFSSNIICDNVEQKDCVQNFKVSLNDTVSHKYYRDDQFNNDIALIRLPKPADLTDNVSPICLPHGDFEISDDPENLFIAGWGTIDGGHMANILRVTSVKHKKTRHCNAVDERNICAIENSDKDRCVADFGGPLQVLVNIDNATRMVLYGITTYGAGTCTSDERRPGAFMSVPFFIDFILNNMVE